MEGTVKGIKPAHSGKREDVEVSIFGHQKESGLLCCWMRSDIGTMINKDISQTEKLYL